MRRTGAAELAISVLVCWGLVTGCTGGGDDVAVGSAPVTPPASTDSRPPRATTPGSQPPPPTEAPTTTVARPVVEVPNPPAPTAISGATPQEQALSLAQSVGAAGDPVSGWLAVYDALGIPVLGEGGVGIGSTGDDPVGPPFAMVWMLADAATRSSGLPLTDVVRMYVDDDQPSIDLADALLTDLRAAVVSTDPQQALFGNFVTEQARRSGARSELLDPAVSAADVYVDAGTAQLVSWHVLRSMTAVAAAGSTAILGLRAPATSSARSLQAGTPCAEVWGDETTTYWVNWFAGKIGSGVQLPGMLSATKGLVEKISELNPHILSSDMAAKANTLAKRASLIGSLLSLIMQVTSLTVDASQSPDPFERNKRISQGDGKSTTITWTVRMDIGSLPDGNQKALCAASFLLNTLGVGFSFPTDGALAGVDVTFQGRVGFADRLDETGAFVYQDMNELTRTTDASGATTTKITGRAQKRDFPDSAQRVIREFSLDVAAQVEEENLNSLLNVFFDGLSFGVAADGYGIAAGAVDIAKTLHWNLGEHTFRMYDWQAGWKIDQEAFGYHFTGIVCDTMQPFTIDAVGNLAGVSGVGAFTVIPTATSTASWSFVGAMGGGVFSYHAEGTGEIQTPENAEVVVRLNASSWVADTPAGSGPMGEHIPTVDLVLVPLETEECSSG